MQRYKHIYGPVLSRRLGRSLGVDVIPFKTCTYDCVYCLLGRTTHHTMEVKEYVARDVLLEELSRKLKEDTPDAISFAGSGEPTLNSCLGEVIHEIKKMTSVPVVVFTNSSLLWMPEVRENLREADIISPSLDAARADTAQAVNRLVDGLDYARIYEGLQTFCREFDGRIWLEILFAAGINDTPEDLDAFVEAVHGLENIECTQLNTVVRPPAEKYVAALTRESLEGIARRLPGHVEIIASLLGDASAAHGTRHVTGEEVSDLIERHPSTLEGVAEGLDISLDEARKILDNLVANGTVLPTDRDGKTFFVVRNPS